MAHVNSNTKRATEQHHRALILILQRHGSMRVISLTIWHTIKPEESSLLACYAVWLL
jgi:hypothetical protein